MASVSVAVLAAKLFKYRAFKSVAFFLYAPDILPKLAALLPSLVQS